MESQPGADMSDEAELAGLTAELRAGRREAWGRLYVLTHLPLLRTLRRLLRNDLLAEDALQATYVTAIERIDRFDPAQGCVDAWLAGIARHKAQESHRESRPRYDARGAAGPLAEPESGLDRPEAERVARALDTLDPRYAEVLRRKYIAGESLESIAGALGLKPATVGTWLHRGRERFREAYGRAAAAQR
jgi:RNA polymerase sigma-70 factor (ECF subfamily)